MTKRSDYLGAIHYEDPDGDATTSALEITFITHEEGRFRPNGSDMIYEYNLTDHLGNTRITFGDADADGAPDILQENHYYPFGMAMTMSSTPTAAPPNDYLYNGKELQTELGLDWYDYGARWYDPATSRFTSIDRFAEKYAFQSPYTYAANNPIKFIDVNGDSIFVNSVGDIVRNDNTDNLVFLQQEGNLTPLGELGGEISADFIYSNLLAQNTEEAKGMWNPFSFRDKVRNKGEWDLKNDKSSIFGLGNDGETTFLFQGNSMESQDLGNHHFGAVAKAFVLFPSEEFILRQAGEAQMVAGTSQPEWQVYKEETRYNFSKTGRLIPFTEKVMQPPYGDDPRDQAWIKAGFRYYENASKNNRP